MIHMFSGVNFGRQFSNLRDSISTPNVSNASNKLLRQPAQDEVVFTGATLKARILLDAAKKLGLTVKNTGGKHGVKIIGMRRPIPVPMHGSEALAKGTAQSIAKELGFKNVRELLKFAKA